MKNVLIALALILMLFVASESKAKTPVIELDASTTVVLRGPVTDASAAKAGADILNLHAKLPKGKAIILFLDTPGGSITAGNGLIEVIKGLPRKVVTVTAYAASMGYQIVQALSTRYILESGTLMSHRAAIGGLRGQVPGEANSRLKHISELVEEMEVSTSKRLNMSVKEYKELIRDELWLTGRISVATKHADKVVRARCNANLSGIVSESIDTMFGPVKVTMHRCPLISGPLKVDTGEDSSEFTKKAIQDEINGYFSKSKGIWAY